ncbi:DUF1289 domain-containing protein [Zoogloea sp.]|uniref:DUF1289 domain-containing protein n=1 Tax=Zoogloea sp. TaxID=49181 RepID=UPI001415F650|nr:MAG: DUF1289 domain-containing protein [Zoogloea sp.]
MSIVSPCINICRMSQASGYCEGCFRTIPEITEWSRASDARKTAILAEVAARRQATDLIGGELRRECVGDA